MKINKIFSLIIAFSGSMSLAYFWEDWGKPVTPQEKVKKEEIDLKYRKKTADIEYKKQKAVQDSSQKAQEKQQKLEHKKQQLELNRKKDRLKVEIE